MELLSFRGVLNELNVDQELHALAMVLSMTFQFKDCITCHNLYCIVLNDIGFCICMSQIEVVVSSFKFFNRNHPAFSSMLNVSNLDCRA